MREKKIFIQSIQISVVYWGSLQQTGGVCGHGCRKFKFFWELAVILCILTLFEGTFTVKSFDKLREVKDKQIKILILITIPEFLK